MRLVSILLAFPLLSLLSATQALALPDLVRTLPNKVTVVVREIRTRPIVSIQAWVRAGSRDETERDRGLAAVTSQCIMEATAKRDPGAMQKEVYALAGMFASEGGYDCSYFDVTLPSVSFRKGLGLLAEGLVEPRLDAATVSAAIGRAQGFSRTIFLDADRASVNQVRARLHEGTPLVSPLAVHEHELSAITPTLVQRFYNDYYVAENLTVVVTGDVDPEDAVQKVESAFGGMRRGKASSRSRFSERALEGPRAAFEKNPKDTGGTAVTIGFRAPAWSSADALALDVLMAVLVDNPLSRTQKRLNEGNAEYVRASAVREYEIDGGSVTISLATQPDSLQDAEGALLTLIEQARSTPVTPEEFREAVKTVMQREVFSRADLSGVGRALALAQLRGSPGADDVFLQRLNALRPEDLIAVARKYLDVKRAVVVEMGPDEAARAGGDVLRRVREKQTVYEAAYRSGPQVTASSDNERAARVDAPLKQIQNAKPVNAGRGRVARSVLPGGARLLVSEDHSAPLVTVSIYMLGGVRYENDKNNGITSVVREMLLNTNDPAGKGLTYRQTISQIGGIVSYQDKDMWGCAVTVPSSSWQTTLAKLGSMFAHPDLDTINVDATRIYVLDALDQWLHDDQAQRDRLIFPTKYQVSGYRLPALGTHKALVNMPHTEIVGWYRKFVVQPNMVVTVFGDVDAASATSAAEQAVREVSTKAFAPGTVAKEGEFEGFREKWELGQGPYSTVTIAFDGPPARSTDIPALYVVAALLGGPKGWLEEYIMTTGGARGVNAALSQALDESPLLLTVTVNGPLQEEDMVKLAFRQVKKAALVPLHGDLAPDLLNAKILAAGRAFMGLDSNPTRALQFARAELFGLGTDYPILLPAKIDGITSNDLLRIGLRYFQKNQWERAAYSVAETRPGGW